MPLPRMSFLFAATGLVAALGCSSNPYSSGGGGGGGCTPTATQVCMGSASFNPVNLTITAGTMLTWKNGSGATHTVTSDPGSADTYDTTVGASGTFQHTFSTPGTYHYHCTLHGAAGSGMHGTITVN